MAGEHQKPNVAEPLISQYALNRAQSPTIVSPYTSQAVTVSIGTSGAIYTLLQAIVDQYAGLKKRVDTSRPGTPIELREVDEDVGHTLIHYIYTGQYQTLGLDSVPFDLRATTEFKRSVLAYCAALLCGIDSLEQLTKGKMEDSNKDLSVFDMQRVVEEVTPKLPRNDKWFAESMQKWIKTKMVNDDTLLTEGRLLDVIGRSALFDRAVVKGVAEMYGEQVAKARNAVDTGNRSPVQPMAATKPLKMESISEATADMNKGLRGDSGVPVGAQLSVLNGTLIAKPAESNSNGIQTRVVDSSVRQNGTSADPFRSEEDMGLAETPSEWDNTESSPAVPSKPLHSTSLEPQQPSNGANGEPPHAENLKATDSDGEGSKTKSTKKSKKTKKRKDSISVAGL